MYLMNDQRETVMTSNFTSMTTAWSVVTGQLSKEKFKYTYYIALLLLQDHTIRKAAITQNEIMIPSLHCICIISAMREKLL